MRSFDCLHRDCSVFGPHLLEASAGTGKTFSIEHVVVRLLLEGDGMELDQILAVTFTKAATRDLKRRIRANLEQALLRIQTKQEGWDYLTPFLGSDPAAEKLSDAILAFDQVQIFTIHGFCYRMLKQFAFEAKLILSFQDPEHQRGFSDQLYKKAKKFLETGIDETLLCPEQMVWLYKEYDTKSALIRRLLKGKKEKGAPPFSELLRKFIEGFATWIDPIPIKERLFEQFTQIASSFKKMRDVDFEKQLTALSQCKENPSQAFRTLLKERGSLFSFLSPENKKVKATVILPPFFEWVMHHLPSLIAPGMDLKNILGALQHAWEVFASDVLTEEPIFDPDEILKKMSIAIKEEAFSSQVREKYRAAIIDEFQDTDPLQWEIFKNLFLESPYSLRAFYLVGDPKQSIYRFRSADVYTYFEAKKTLGTDAFFCLDTNYRSSAPLINALNALFHRNWLPLPKIDSQISSPPVKAGRRGLFNFADGKEAIHFLISDSFEESFLPYAISEIERLLPLFPSPSSFAILVRDRYGMEFALKACEMRGIPAIAKSNTSLSETLGFQAIQELFKSLASPKEMSLQRKVLLGPFATIQHTSSIAMLNERKFIDLCRLLFSISQGTSLEKEIREVIEVLLTWEGQEGFALYRLLQFLDDFEKLEPEEGNGRRIDAEKEAVQILTLHASKGLEFDVVFALGLAARPPSVKEEVMEIEAEKLRQLYVAMTRAKYRLYVPLPLERPKGRGPLSAAEAFCQTLISQEGDVLSFLERTKHVSYEKLPPHLPLSFASKKQVETLLSPPLSIPSISSSFLHSFTSLSHPQTSELAYNKDTPSPLFTPHTIPPGVEIGILIHRIFERLFSSPTPIWNDLTSVEQIVSEEVDMTLFFPWKQAIQEMVWKTLCLPLPLETPLSLKDLPIGQVQAEMEFLFSDLPHFIKGFIDLIFFHQEKFYFVDWKTNWLGMDETAYSSLEKTMTEHDYWLQAKLYKEALKRHVKRFYICPFEEIFGGAIYLFVRGGGICHFNPN